MTAHGFLNFQGKAAFDRLGAYGQNGKGERKGQPFFKPADGFLNFRGGVRLDERERRPGGRGGVHPVDARNAILKFRRRSWTKLERARERELNFVDARRWVSKISRRYRQGGRGGGRDTEGVSPRTGSVQK